MWLLLLLLLYGFRGLASFASHGHNRTINGNLGHCGRKLCVKVYDLQQAQRLVKAYDNDNV